VISPIWTSIQETNTYT